jgi:hypothetical protein
MEKKQEDLSAEEKEFTFRLKTAPEDVRDMYYRLLARDRAERGKNGMPPPYKLEDKWMFLAKANTLAESAKKYGVDPLKMRRDYEKYHDRRGRPPIGGAQDD